MGKLLKYKDLKTGDKFYFLGCANYPKEKRGDGHIDIRDNITCPCGNPNWDVVVNPTPESAPIADETATCEYCGSDYYAFANCPNCGNG